MNKILQKTSRILVVLLAVFIANSSYAKEAEYGVVEKTITGQVTDENDEPQPGVNVLVKNTAIGTITDINGNYRLDVPDDAAILVFSSVGYTTEEITIGDQAIINVAMFPDIQALQEIVVVGYGTQSRATVTSAIASVDGENLHEIPTPTVTSVLQGKVAGVRVLATSGQPGNQLNVRIRGGSSINKSNDPLYIVDGFPRDINDVNPQDITSIEVLKDAAAAAIYGARASNGVVLITTRRGEQGTSNIDFHYSFGTQEFPRKIETLSSAQFLEVFRPLVQTSTYKDGIWFSGPQSTGTGNDENSTWTTRFLEDGEAVPAGWQSIIDPVTGRTLVFQDNDMQENLFQRAPQQNFYVSANGGSDKIRYAAGVGYTDQQGVAVNTYWKRFSGRANVDFRLNDKVTLTTMTDFSFSNTNRFENESALFSRGAFLARTIRDELPDGTPGWGINGSLANPLWVQATRENDRTRTIATVGGKLDWQIVNDLSFRGTVNYHINQNTRDYFERSHVFNQSRPAIAQRNQATSWQYELTLNYEKTFLEKHNLMALIGYTDLYLADDNVNVQGRGAATDNIPTLNAAPEPTRAFTFRSEERLISQFARLNYNFDYKYLLSASVRRDGSSKFGADRRYGIFPSVSAGWVISNEAFYPSGISNVLSEAKFRASVGQTGNNGVGRYTSQGNYNPIYNYAGNAGISAVAMPNSDLGWETTTQYNVGFDLGFLKNQRINVLVDYFVKQTDDLLFTVQLPRETGFNSIETNVGSVSYNGIELAISTENIRTNNFSWTTDFNIAYVDNEVLKLPEREGIDKNRINGLIFPDGTGVGGIAEGERLDAFIGWKVNFLIDNQEQADAAHFDEQALGYDPATETSTRGRKFPGDFEWQDRDGDGRITNLDQYVLGYSQPRTTGGLNNTFRYKGFELTVFLDFALGHSIADESRGWWNGVGARDLSPTTDILNAWKQPGDAAITNQPRVVFHDPRGQRNHFRTSDFYTYSADFVSLRDVRLGYNFSDDLLEKVKFLRSARLYVAGNNLHYCFSPERGGENNRGGSYPPFRIYTAGIKLGI